MKLLVALAALFAVATAQNMQYRWTFDGDGCTAATMVELTVATNSNGCTSMGCTCENGACEAIVCSEEYDRNLLASYGHVRVYETYTDNSCDNFDSGTGHPAGVCRVGGSSSAFTSCGVTLITDISYSDELCENQSASVNTPQDECASVIIASAKQFCTSGASTASVTALSLAIVGTLIAFFL
eukprot:NODE_2037_length_666_cov_53.881262_g1987_i0.p1 GENE.NODE_2037_length_666_cov_53.881262_g1987_i0~~NODE_2037_length_666_cov_53.881262_g1987_i0.p1  ORF type:complete len:183 (-),score=24.21 NODE_2037_length_666_cov_53.881262_g1987_i0:12-560(-)